MDQNLPRAWTVCPNVGLASLASARSVRPRHLKGRRPLPHKPLQVFRASVAPIVPRFARMRRTPCASADAVQGYPRAEATLRSGGSSIEPIFHSISDN
ncbi:conserved protein of unknown function (plasmid) [Cupriavidus neocaledonicus]|uniref:Uncharacterized protein n=1 Tax=Cupriavidus neocaledonicus TaxID=1040979 RepID=A0A375HR76_9BURK|nr:conserved hypothetical protein [Cupriavidus neocaledonicus]SPD60701.1 conserved protein of unknown function [Cupriavidus neocaledonicus]